MSTYNPKAKIIMNRVVLAGDAAGLINSLNGEGIQYAMLSGRWAAESLIECLAMNDFSTEALRAYEAKVKDNVGYDMSFSNMIIQFIRNRNFNPLWLKLLGIISEKARKDDDYATIAGGILAGLVPAKRAVTPSFIGKSLVQGITTIANDTLEAAKKGPVGISALGMQAAGFAMAQLSAMVQQPSDYWKWTKGLTENGVEFSGYVLKDLKKKIPGKAMPPSRPSPEGKR